MCLSNMMLPLPLCLREETCLSMPEISSTRGIGQIIHAARAFRLSRLWVIYQVMSHNMGWECPKCGRVYSPTTSMCAFCAGSQPYIITCGSGSRKTPAVGR